jgi:GNAT superfamily N-acetyltransferase
VKVEFLTEPEIDASLRARLLELTGEDEASDMRVFLRPSTYRNYAWAIVATEHGHVVGWAAVYGCLRRRLYMDVFVDPGHRCRGIGRMLLDAARPLNKGAILLSESPFYRHAAPDLEPIEREGIPLLLLRCSAVDSSDNRTTV